MEGKTLGHEEFGHDYFHGVGSNYPTNGYESLFDFLKIYFSRILDFIVYYKGFRISLLDVGCAYGFLVKLAYERGLDAYGVDISSYAIEKGCELNPEITNRLFVGRAEEVDKIFSKEIFDVITALEILEHVSNPKEVLSSFHSCIKVNGWLLITTQKPRDPDFDKTHISVRPLKHWVRDLKELGFKVKAPYLFDLPLNSKIRWVRWLGRYYPFAEIWHRIKAHLRDTNFIFALKKEYG